MILASRKDAKVQEFFYNKDAKYIVYNTGNSVNLLKKALKHIKAEQLIIDFYMWDAALKKFENSDNYIKFLGELRELGVNKLCGMDFSMFNNMPRPVLVDNLYKNLVRVKQAQDLGFKLVFNFNIVHEFKEVYKHSLPETIKTVIFDDNHSEFRDNKEAIKIEAEALKMLADITKINTIIVQTTSKKPVYLYPLIAMAEDLNIRHKFIPSATNVSGKLITG